MTLWARRGFLAVLVFLGYGMVVARSLTDVSAGSASYVLTVALMVLAGVAGVRMQRRAVLPIHDREVDWIIGLLAMLMAVSVDALLVPRLVEWLYLLRLDVLALVLFMFGAVTLLLGSRAALRYGPVWVSLALVNAPVSLVVTLLTGGGWAGASYATVFGITVTVFLVSSARVRTRLATTAASAVVGVVLTAAVVGPVADHNLVGTLPAAVNQVIALLPGVVGGLAATRVIAVLRRRRGTAPAVPGETPVIAARLALVPVAAVVLALVLVPTPAYPSPVINQVPPTPPVRGGGEKVPEGWAEIGRESYPWVENYFGAGSTLTRQALQATTVVGEWDVQGRTREVMVDSLTTTGSFRTRIFGDESLYTTVGGRRSEMRQVDLGHGVVGSMYTVLDDEKYLTYTKLRVYWDLPDGVGEEGVEGFSVIAVDDHRPGAQFPVLTRNLGGLATRVVEVLLRGGTVTEDPTATFNDSNDGDVVVTVGRSIVDGRWAQTGGETR